MFTPITVPSRSSPETFAAEAELAIAGLAQFILDYNQLGSVLNTAITSTSITSLAIGTGSKSLTVQAGLNLVPGYPVRIAYTTTPTDNMDGTVTTYNSSTGALVVNVASVNGSGTYATWQVMVLPSATGNFADKSTANTFTDVQTFTGGVAANPLVKKQSDPTAGGALLLEKSSGSSLSGNLKIELSGNSLRIYENGGTSRGLTVDLTALDASIASQLITSASKLTSSELITGTDNVKYATALAIKTAYPIRTLMTAWSAPYTPASGESLSAAHGQSVVPYAVQLVLECISADLGYSPGDRITPTGYWNGSGTNSLAFFATSTVVGVKAVAGFTVYIQNPTTGAAATPAAGKWKYAFEFKV